MEVAMSAVAGELVVRFISLLMAKYSKRVTLEKEAKRLQQLLLRVHTVIEEADGRYITNSGMLMQLKIIASTMYQGYRVLDNMRCIQIKKGSEVQQVSNSSGQSLAIRLKRQHTAMTNNRAMSLNHELQTALENLKDVIANMSDFVILLRGCERLSRTPYDTYLYHDNFMFSRHAEKQHLCNILLQHNPPGLPLVIPIIGGRVVWKKTLVTHVCGDERVRRHFSSILHLDGGSICKKHDYEKNISSRTLIVVEFASDVDDNDWEKFYSSVASMGMGSKVIIISRIQSLERFGTVKTLYLNRLSDDELSYLFKTLAFGSANPVDHPQLVSMLKEFKQLWEDQLGVHTQ